MKSLDDAALLVAVQSGVDEAQYDTLVLESLAGSVGADTAAYVRPSGPGQALGFYQEARWRVTLPERYPHYERELASLIRVIEGGGVGVDTEHCSTLQRSKYYRELVAHERATQCLYGGLVVSGRHIGTIMLGRRTGGFTERERAHLRSTLPLLSVAEMARAAQQPRSESGSTELPDLTGREREILACLRLGYRNGDIATMLGTSPNTVRNQLARLYSKLGVSGRTEAIALVLEADGGRCLE